MHLLRYYGGHRLRGRTASLYCSVWIGPMIVSCLDTTQPMQLRGAPWSRGRFLINRSQAVFRQGLARLQRHSPNSVRCMQIIIMLKWGTIHISYQITYKLIWKLSVSVFYKHELLLMCTGFQNKVQGFFICHMINYTGIIKVKCIFKRKCCHHIWFNWRRFPNEMTANVNQHVLTHMWDLSTMITYWCA